MAEDYPYYDYEEGWKKKFEATIPILLLILVVLVLAWKMQWLCGLPVVGAVCSSPVSNILIVGNDPDIAMTLDEIKVGLPLNYEVFTLDDINNLRDASYLNNYDLIILTEKIDPNNPAEMPSLFREYLSDYLANNGKLILYGIAGSRVPGEPFANGWKQANIDKYIPVTCTTGSGLCDASESKDTRALQLVTLKINDIHSPILQEFGMSANFTQGASIDYAIVNVDEGRKLATIEVKTTGNTPLAYNAIVESSHGLTGKTIYFAYNPSRTPTIFKNAIKYLLNL